MYCFLLYHNPLAHSFACVLHIISDSFSLCPGSMYTYTVFQMSYSVGFFLFLYFYSSKHEVNVFCMFFFVSFVTKQFSIRGYFTCRF